MRDSKRLLSIFRSLSESRQQALFEYAEFLAGKEGAEIAEARSAVPLPIPRREQDNVVKAIQSLMQTYPMLERNRVFHEASAQMTRHLIHGVAAFAAPHELQVGDGAGTRRVSFAQCVIAVGPESGRLPGLPDDPRVIEIA